MLGSEMKLKKEKRIGERVPYKAMACLVGSNSAGGREAVP